MANPLPPRTHHTRPIHLPRKRRRRIVREDLARLLRVVPEHARPLLDRLGVVVPVEHRVRQPVVDEHPGPRPVVAGGHVARRLRPRFLALDEGAARALRVPAVGGARVEAACWYAGVD